MNPQVQYERRSPEHTKYKLIKKEEWSDSSIPWGKPLPLPVKSVRFVFKTNSNVCGSLEDCKVVMRDIQEQHRRLHNLYEINFNFLIGGDGNVYEGRGFRRKISRMPSHNSPKVLEYLTIGYIGDHELIPKYMIDSAYDFLRDMVKEGLLGDNVLGNSQVVKLSQTL